MSDELQLSLAATKLRPPAPPGRLVRRSRLDALLDTAMDGPARLVLLSAPAGSGKSTLLVSWLSGRPEQVAWLQVERNDSDPARFWSFLVRAIARSARVDPRLEQVVAGSGGDDLVVVSEIVNALAATAEPLIVAIDDYHLIDDGRVHRGVERLVALCPEHVTIVISTRMDPPFRLGRSRLRGLLVEVREADLRFDGDEARELLGPVAGALDRGLVQQLCSRTEGWAAGLVLAGLSLQGASDPAEFVGAFRGDDRLVVEYLRDEMLSVLDADDRRRLLETSILEQLGGDLVDAVTGRPDGSTWLRRTAETNQLLVRLDRTGTWFRYHHLLRDLLRSEALQQLPEHLSELHARAAAWFEARGDHRDAVAHWIAAGDLDRAAGLMKVLGPDLLRSGQIDSLREVLAQLGDVAGNSTACVLLHGWCNFIGGRYSLAETWSDTALDIADDAFDETKVTPLRINIALARGEVATALSLADELHTDGVPVRRSSDLVTAVGAAQAWAGRTEDARSTLGLAVELADDEGTRSAQVLALVYLAISELDAGSIARAAAASGSALDTAGAFGLSAYHGVAPAYAVRGRTAASTDGARHDARHAVELARRASTPLALAYVLTTAGDTLADLGDPDGATLLAEARTVVDRCPDPGLVGRHLARVEARHGVAATTAQVGGLVEQLTERELAVLHYLPTSLSQRDIAAELYVSLNTVKTHCRSIYRKLGVGDRKAAVQAARDLRVV